MTLATPSLSKVTVMLAFLRLALKSIASAPEASSWRICASSVSPGRSRISEIARSRVDLWSGRSAMILRICAAMRGVVLALAVPFIVYWATAPSVTRTVSTPPVGTCAGIITA